MTLQLDITYLITLAIGIVGAFWGLAKMLLAQTQRHIDDRLGTLADGMRAQDEGARRIERDLMELRAELPRDYVRREDHTRTVAAIQVAIDNLRLTVERAIFERDRSNKP